ncbi:MAG TPA: hypothetical protein VKY40_07370, partial [Halanaerobiales bacterium]|nr:hypothetical protein [Halanaerobiales bacterium]
MRKRKLFLFVLLLMVLLLGSGVFVNQTTLASEETDELVVSFPIVYGNYKDVDLVQEEISKITREKLNVKVELLPLRIGNFMQQINLMLSGNE